MECATIVSREAPALTRAACLRCASAWAAVREVPGGVPRCGGAMIQLLSQGVVALVLLYGGALALILALVLLVLYRLMIGRLMRGVPSVGPGEHREDGPRLSPPTRLAYMVETSTQVLAKLGPGRVGVDPGLGYAAVYVAAGVAFGLVATVLLLAFSGIGFVPLRVTAVTWAFAWPMVLTLNLLWGPDHRR